MIKNSKLFFRKLFMQKLSDLSKSYADPTIAIKQRQLVDQQLQSMRNGNAPEHFKVVGRILSQLKGQIRLKTIDVLDAGCGSAYYSEIVNFFVPGWIKYVGVDFNRGMLDMAQKFYPTLPLAYMDLQNLAIRDESFDLVMSGAVIVHIREWNLAVRELARLTRRWLLLHRTLVYTDGRPTSVTIERHYDRDVYRVRINEGELLTLMSNLEMNLAIKCNAGEGELPVGQENNTYLFDRMQPQNFGSVVGRLRNS
jgi:SAM-dependent methyltransferase